MALYCKNGVHECDGCGICQENDPVFYDVYDDPVYEGDDYYHINNEFIAEANIYEYLKSCKFTCEKD